MKRVYLVNMPLADVKAECISTPKNEDCMTNVYNKPYRPADQEFFSLTASTAQMAQTEEIMFQNVAY